MIINAGLILEGGGMRGVYTAGALDFFMDADVWLSHCYGVSAGAVNATNTCQSSGDVPFVFQRTT